MPTRIGSAYRPTARQREAVHDLRNLFSVIAAARQMLERDPAGAQQRMLLDALGDAAERGGQITTSLLTAESDIRKPCLDTGARLADLLPMMRALAGRTQVALDADISLPQAQVRMAGEAYDASILELIANAVAAGAGTINVRNHMVGTRVWTLVSDDGRGMRARGLMAARSGQDTGSAHGGGLSRIHRFARTTHGHLLMRSRPGAGTAIALILPTVLSAASLSVSDESPSLNLEEKKDEKDGQRIAA